MEQNKQNIMLRKKHMSRYISVKILLIIALFSFMTQAVLAETEVNDQEESKAEVDKKWISGRFDFDVDGVWADGEADIDLDQSLILRIDPPKYKRIHIRSSLWMHEDVDSDEEQWSALRDINDISHTDMRASLLHLYVDVDDLWGDSVLRLGRQRIIEGAAFNRIDGLYFKQNRKNWDWYAFAGVRASIYRDAHNDPAYGGGMSFRASPRSRIAIDSYFSEEEISGGKWWFDYSNKLHDEMVSLSLWHLFSPKLQIFSRYDWRDGEGDKVLLNATGYFEQWDLSYELSYRGQLNSLSQASNDLTGFYRILGTYEEYDNFLASFHIPITKKLAFSLEGELHNAHHDEWSSANRDYHRYAAILSSEKLLFGLDTSISLERWDVDGGESTWALTGEIRKRWDKFQLALGADYERYRDKIVRYNSFLSSLDSIWVAINPNVFPRANGVALLFDTLVVETHEDIYSFYAKTKWSFKDNQDIRLDLTYECDDGPESPYFRVRTSYEIRF